MKDPIKKALTRRIRQQETPPDPRLVLGVKLTIAMTISLTTLEITHLIALKQWNSEIFSAITGLTGTLTGIFITQKT
ncbi:MAG: hypothetical protein QHH18_07510 [Candidatus Bathyarchaeota archaeon]|jgi:hypothetical protein|nr:hypothetical protein [Candidatus Bathyarchaeota archaeon A05DMB-5]MDH7558429.1 hypothetical protein [Candidatus Bathyarchaeota archaeon]